MRMWGNSYRLSRLTDTYDMQRMADTIDVTTHESSGDKQFISSLRGGGATIGGIFDGSSAHAQEAIASAMQSTTPNVYTIAFEGDTVGKIAHLYRAREKQINITSPAAGRIGLSIQHDAVDHILSGRMNIRGTLATASTGASASVDNGAATALGGTAHFHVTDTAAALGSITAKIQHSSAGVSWADLCTFTTTSTGYSSVDTTGLAVKRFTRGIVTALSGASTVYLAAAFARKTA